MKIRYNYNKISTGINGFDDLLFGGLQLQTIREAKPLTILVRGETGTSRALLAMQLLHGVTKSLRGLKSDDEEGMVIGDPIFYTEYKSKSNISDMLLDSIISKCISHIVEENAKGKKDKWQNNLFSNTIFKIPQNIITSIDISRLDSYIGQEIIVYNYRTNALNLAFPSKALSRNILNDDTFAIGRMYDDIEKYCHGNKGPELGGLSSEFFNISILDNEGQKKGVFTVADENAKIPCIVLDTKYSEEYNEMLKTKALVVIYLENAETKIGGYNADMIIEMRNHTDVETEYVCQQLAIKKSVLQDTAHGWHQYKKRDYGIEVYPSSHVILQRRRHMPKGVLRAQMDILSETYQHFVDNKEDFNSNDALAEFINRKNSYKEDNLKELYEKFSRGDCPEDILQNILLGGSDKKCQVTAIVGSANTYKRHLALGGTFSAGCKGEHTLNILLDKENSIILQKMICPATIFKNSKSVLSKKISSCIKCYECIHFKEIRMGCISSDEFFYYLIQQLRVSSESVDQSRQIKRIVIDDLQRIEFCFPMIRKDSLFLTALISICRDYRVDLFILCDRSSEMIQALRAQADNVICTERTRDNDLNVYIEHYSGPSSPSRIWGCHITDIKDLFYCDIEPGKKKYRLNEKSIESFSVYSMDDYWKK